METGRIPTGCIVVGIDAVRATDRALDWAADQAALEGRHLHLVHGTGSLLTLGSASAVTGTPGPLEITAELQSTGHAVLGRATTRAVSRHPELVVHRTLRTADPGQLLVDLSTDAVLVVVGSRGRGHVLRLALGSVSEDVAARAACPVVVLRPRDGDTARAGVLVAVEEAADAVPALGFALHQAAVRRQPLTVLLTGNDAPPASPHVVPAEQPAQRQSLLAALAAAGASEGEVETRLLVGRGTPSECVLALAEDMDLVVVGRRPIPGHGRPGHGSFAIDVLDNAPATVAVVPCCK
jgi:nucleotide-binding universal stress UspA family protein